MLKIKELCFKISTIGPLGYWATGGIIANLLVIPLLYLARMVYNLHVPIFFIVSIILAALSILVIHLALSFPTDKDSSVIVLDRALGFIIVFIGVPFSIKFLIVGFILFNLFNFLRPFLLYRLWNFSLEELPGVLGILTGPVLTGIIINLFFQFAAWIAT